MDILSAEYSCMKIKLNSMRRKDYALSFSALKVDNESTNAR